jgi:predicted Zn-dependent protease
VVSVVKTQTEDNLKILLSSAQEFEVQVFYETGAEPYVGNTQSGKPYWNLFENNLKAVFEARNMSLTLTVPKTLEEMTSMGEIEQETWTSEQLLEKASSLTDISLSGKKGKLVILFVNGAFQDNAGIANPNIIGASLTGSIVIGIFKDVIKRSEEDQQLAVAKFTEQFTLIHEAGHAFGLVNNGIPLSGPHHDSEHGAHCSNQDCVMYWQNEGRSELIDFVRKIILTGSSVLYGTECLNDVKEFDAK